MSHSYFTIKEKHLIIEKVQGGEIKIIQGKTISNLHIFLLCYFVIEALQFSNIYIPSDDHISLFPYPAPTVKAEGQTNFS